MSGWLCVGLPAVCLCIVLFVPGRAAAADQAAALRARIVRNKTSRAATLVMPQDTAWALYTGAADSGVPLLTGTGSGAFAVPVPAAGHTLFTVRTDGETYALAERLLPLSGAWNVRDMGGFAGIGGKRVRWGRLFRADDLYCLTETDRTYLASIPLVSVFDFRTEEERLHAPDLLPGSVRQVFVCPVRPGKLTPNAVRRGYAPDEAEALMCRVYEDLVTDEANIAVYRQFFARLAEPDTLPMLFHCSAGKDRTGLAAALLLFALGVERDEVMEDYLASRVYLKGKYADTSAFYTVDASFLHAAVAAVERRHGSMEAFLRTDLGVDPEALQSRFLE
jgi:Protein tyrosine/serine phosphatase